jgi:hypothetical protein
MWRVEWRERVASSSRRVDVAAYSLAQAVRLAAKDNKVMVPQVSDFHFLDLGRFECIEHCAGQSLSRGNNGPPPVTRAGERVEPEATLNSTYRDQQTEAGKQRDIMCHLPEVPVRVCCKIQQQVGASGRPRSDCIALFKRVLENL